MSTGTRTRPSRRLPVSTSTLPLCLLASATSTFLLFLICSSAERSLWAGLFSVRSLRDDLLAGAIFTSPGLLFLLSALSSRNINTVIIQATTAAISVRCSRLRPVRPAFGSGISSVVSGIFTGSIIVCSIVFTHQYLPFQDLSFISL